MVRIYVQLALLVGDLKRRTERGLSQSTENAILLAGAVAVAGVVITLVSQFVLAKLEAGLK